MFKFDLGKGAKDIVSGFTGIITSRAEFITGCRQYAISPDKVGKDGKLQEAVWLDEGRITLTGKNLKLDKKDSGGPQVTPHAY